MYAEVNDKLNAKVRDKTNRTKKQQTEGISNTNDKL